MRLPAVLALALALTLAVPPAQAQEVGPGPNPAAGAEAAAMFVRICAATLPAFQGAEQAIAGYPLRQHPDTGTWFHRDLDLSVKLHVLDGTAVCSMVFSSPDAGEALTRTFVDSVTGLYAPPPRTERATDGTTIAYLPGGAVFELTAGDAQSGLYRALMAAGTDAAAAPPAPAAADPARVQEALVQLVMPLDARGGGGLAAGYATCLLGRGDIEATAGFMTSRGFLRNDDTEMGEVVLYSETAPYAVIMWQDQPFCGVYSESNGTAAATAQLMQATSAAGLPATPGRSPDGCTEYRIGDALVAVSSTGQDPSCEDPGTSAVTFSWN